MHEGPIAKGCCFVFIGVESSDTPSSVGSHGVFMNKNLEYLELLKELSLKELILT